MFEVGNVTVVVLNVMVLLFVLQCEANPQERTTFITEFIEKYLETDDEGMSPVYSQTSSHEPVK